jgi:hypothetical protein
MDIDEGTRMDIDEATKHLNELAEQRRQLKLAEVRQDWLTEHAVECGSLDGHAYWVVTNPAAEEWKAMPPELLAQMSPITRERMSSLGFNGYLHFAKRPVTEPELGGILVYVPVHGGITYWGNHDGGVVYGFDTGHCDSHEFPTKDVNWVTDELQHMLRGIEMAAKVEQAYLLATDEKVKAELAEAVRQTRPGGCALGFGAMLNLLSGRL